MAVQRGHQFILILVFRLFKETGVAAAAAAVGGRPSMKTEVTQFSLSKDNLRSLRHLQSRTTSMNDDV